MGDRDCGGFCAQNRVHVEAGDREGRIKLAGYMLRALTSLSKMRNLAADHRHIMDREEPYRFVSIARLREDFEADVRRVGGADEKED